MKRKMLYLAIVCSGFTQVGCGSGTTDEPRPVSANEELIGPYTVDASCSDGAKDLIERSMRLARIASASPGFQKCVSDLAVGTPNAAAAYYPQCNPTDPDVGLGIQAQVADLLRVTQSPNPMTISCNSSLVNENAQAFIGDLNTTEEALTFSNWINGVVGLVGSQPADPYWPMSQAAGIIWHEVMHNYGYDHPSSCSDPTYGPLYNFQANTIPYIVQGCMSVTVSTAGNVCQNVTCPANSAAMLTDLTTTNCTCVADPATSNMDFFQCAQENGTCTVGQGGKYMAFGVPGQLVYKYFPAGIMTCNRSSFDDQDPAVNQVKNCYMANYSLLASENQSFTAYDLTGVTGPINVAFGADGKFVYAKLDGLTSYTCDRSLFSGADPAPNVPKACYLALAGYHYVSDERYDSTPVLTGLNNTPVAFGANGYFKFAVMSGNVACNTQTFGDPINGVSKACYVMDLGNSYLTSEGNNFAMAQGDYCPVGYTSGTNGNISLVSECSGVCDNTTFGDPAYGAQKYCWGMSLIH